jgi:hypothetical protein
MDFKTTHTNVWTFTLLVSDSNEATCHMTKVIASITYMNACASVHVCLTLIVYTRMPFF